jgi:phospholipid/cholesterol/gamma-HCH transport system permease protein
MKVFNLFELVGNPILKLARLLIPLGEFIVFYVYLFGYLFRRPFRFNIIFKQVETIGVSSWGVISLTALFTGMVEAIQLYNGFKEFGAEGFMGYTIFVSITRELGPVFATLMVISRAISAMTAELGTMRVTEQIDAIDVLGLDSKRYLVTPRVIATAISLPILVILFDIVSNVTAFYISTSVLDINPTTYQSVIQKMLHFSDIFTGVMKAFIFGIAIGMIGAYVGYNTKGGAKGVGISTTQSVVLSSIAMFALNYIMSSIFLMLNW